MKQQHPVHLVLASAAVLAFAAPAFAQSSVTLYGIVDNGIGYQNNSTTVGSTTGGKSVVKMNQGVWAGSRFGLRGTEDLGGGTKAIFVLESGFNSATGAAQFTDAIFGRQAWVGLTNATYGTLTAGRQYASYYQTMSPFSPITWITGYYGAHPGDVDGLDTIYRANNTIEYTSPKLYGFTVSGSYSLGGVAGSTNAGSTWATGVQCAAGPFGLGVAFERVNNSNTAGGAWGANSTTSNGGAQIGVSAVTNGYQTARAQQRFALGLSYRFSDAWDATATYTNTQYIPGSGSKFLNTAIFNAAGAVLHWKPSPVWDFGAGYAYTSATQANGITDNARYHQFNLSQYYSLSKRTGLYLLEAYQHAKGKTLGTSGAGSIVDATATLGDGLNTAPSSTGNQFAVGAGIIHRF
ncbi:Outer membrane protein (Porin) [Paraburkholderia piptadeniae]|uniref:Outer membrane protein (Porin) n=1 Tax=Paraburkholderia piptadeniae TaxID=1701573 RepID=A0A1N7SVV7_9BURK|nr:porin [Paraburkholderia piptadeniae]SIT51515.1 Outer membrane protein (Porin) [Paraburkholderia piptadeniae]